MDFQQQDINKPPHETVDGYLAASENLCHDQNQHIPVTHDTLSQLGHTKLPSTLLTL